MGKKIHIASITATDLKVRKHSGRATQVQKSGKEYDRHKEKQLERKQLQEEASPE